VEFGEILLCGDFFVLDTSKRRLPWLYSGGEAPMKAYQKEQVAALRKEGKSYAAVAEAVGVSVNTIKSYCLRNDLGNGDTQRKKFLCEQCKKPMSPSGRSSRRFCCDGCRMAWWHKHPEKINQKAVYHFTCPVCRKPFTAYGNAKRKYCSRACYGKSKKAVRHE